MKVRRLTTAVLLLIAVCACKPQGLTELSSFISDPTVRLELDGESTFRDSAGECQLASNIKRCEWRAHTDTMLDYFVLSLDSVPSMSNPTVTASIVWSTNSGERSKKDVTLRVKRISGDVVWLCDDARRNAVVIRTLE